MKHKQISNDFSQELSDKAFDLLDSGKFKNSKCLLPDD